MQTVYVLDLSHAWVYNSSNKQPERFQCNFEKQGHEKAGAAVWDSQCGFRDCHIQVIL